jgi:hypothetical protein
MYFQGRGVLCGKRTREAGQGQVFRTGTVCSHAGLVPSSGLVVGSGTQ